MTDFGATLKVEGENEFAFAGLTLAHQEDAMAGCTFL